MRKVKIHITYSVSLAFSDEMLEEMDLEPDCSDSELADALRDQYESDGPEMLNELIYEGPEVKIETLPADAEVDNDETT